MQEQWKKLFRWVLGGGLISVVLLVLALLIIKLVCGGNLEQCDTYVTRISMTIMFVYLVVSGIKLAGYNKYIKSYEQERLEKSKRKITTEYKPVLLKYSSSVSPEMFKCRAKVDEDGKILCEIKLDHKVKFESYEEFLRCFHLRDE